MQQDRGAGTDETCGACVDPDRRRAVGLLAAVGLAAVLPAQGAAADEQDAAKKPPRPGDELVFATGDREGQTIKAADVTQDGALVQAWPKDAASGTVRKGSRLNRILLVRLDPASLDKKTAERAGEGGVVAYSDFCTHAGCFIENYQAADHLIVCHCHSSRFDPRAGG